MRAGQADSIRLTAVVATFNRRPLLQEALQSILDQTESVDEIVVVDDGSTDDTADFIGRLRTDIPLHYIYQNNRGPQAARNAGFDASTGTWIAFCDDDDLWMPQRCATVKRLLHTRPVDLVASDFSLMAADKTIVPFLFERHRQSHPNIWTHFKREPSHEFSFAANIPSTDLLPEYPFWGATVIYSRQTVTEIGGWNIDTLGIPSEDLHFIFRALRNRSIGIIWDPTLCYRVHPGNVSHDQNKKLLGRAINY